jgi:hypothetical protein
MHREARAGVPSFQGMPVKLKNVVDVFLRPFYRMSFGGGKSVVRLTDKRPDQRTMDQLEQKVPRTLCGLSCVGPQMAEVAHLVKE